MKWQDLKQLNDEALKAKIVDFRKELMGMRFQRVTGQAEKTHQVKSSRRSIARIKTMLTQRAKAV